MLSRLFLFSSNSSKWRLKDAIWFSVFVLVVIWPSSAADSTEQSHLRTDDQALRGGRHFPSQNTIQHGEIRDELDDDIQRPNPLPDTSKATTTTRTRSTKTTQETLRRAKRELNRDPYIFNLFEMLLTTVENKLRRVETMDRAIQHLIQRVDSFETTLQDSVNSSNHLIRMVESKLQDPVPPCRPPSYYDYNQPSSPPQPQPVPTHGSYEHYISPESQSINSANVFPPKPSAQPYYYYSEQQPQPSVPEFQTSFDPSLHYMDDKENDSNRWDMIAAQMSKIDSKLSNLENQLNTNSIRIPSSNPDELVVAASENYRVDVGLGTSQQKLYKDQDLLHMGSALDRVQNSVEDLNQRFADHASENTAQLEHMIDNLVQVRQAVVIDAPALANESVYGNVPPLPNNGNHMDPVSKVNLLIQKVTPLEEVQKKMDEVWSVLVGTKSSVDVLVPKSEDILNTSQRQERAIIQFRDNLSEKTDRIINNLGEVEKRLQKMPTAEGTLKEENSQGSPNLVNLQYKTAPELQHFGPVHDNLAVKSQNTKEQQKKITKEVSFKNTTSTETGNTTTTVDNGDESGKDNDSEKKPVASAFVSTSVNDYAVGYSCSDLLKQGHTKNGNYYTRIRGTSYWFLKVNCEMETEGGGWTVIQRRDDYGQPREDFNRDWNEYKHGFGDPEKEFYLGNENIYFLTNTQDHILRIELEDFEGNKRYAEYSTFKLHSEVDLYKIEVGAYKGNAGNSLGDYWYGSNLSPFSTFDKDNDRSSLNCASKLKGGWWWRSCGRGLNGLYLTEEDSDSGRQGIVWFRWRGWKYSLKKSVMMIRPKSHCCVC